jgi:type I restriction enzyme R subunit
MTTIHTEKTFETAIEEELVDKGGYVKGEPDSIDRETALDSGTIIQFLKTSQPKEWKELSDIHGYEIDTKVINRLIKELELRGSLDVIRKGFTDYGVHFEMAFFKPESGLNPDSLLLFDSNILTVYRQVKYSIRTENSLDLVLGINGIPVATAELKNPFTGQTVENAKQQYIKDRDPSEPIFQFKKRTLVHFAVDPDEVYMTTRLNGDKTSFLPFNKGFDNGRGNPLNSDGYRTEYLWNYVWTQDSWLDIIGRYLHLQTEEIESDGRKLKKESLIFPRFHQLDCVRKVSADVKKYGAGKNYLIQHSAGSGKSNSIAWLAYRLSCLHDKVDCRIFDSVIVISDRRVLDSQLQNTIYQFEHKAGVVKKIDKDSQQLADAIYKGSNIIITTLQKFPYIIEKIGEMEKASGERQKRTYAVIVDEAHSSQGGEATKKLKEILSAKSLEEAMEMEEESESTEDYEDEIRKSMMARGHHKKLSFFAFTATPKPKTLEVFGVKDSQGKPQPFHLYSMRQAIEEHFILDVLKGYTTYKTFFRLNKAIEDDPNLNKQKARVAIGRYLSLHPHNISQKTEIIVEHFRQVVSKKIGGRAKAMVVTGSRLHAVRYKLEFDRYIKEKGYTYIKTLVAFSGIVNDEGIEYKETVMNGFGEKELPKKFNTSEYHILLVADKYQTGYDQPLLHTMYVDKKLSGIKAVQTLSRLNRMCPGKEETFVLDFVNDEEEIIEAFQAYYQRTSLELNTDPNHLYDLKNIIENSQIIWQSEVDNFAKVFFKPSYNPENQRQLFAYIDPAIERFLSLSVDKTEGAISQEDVKGAMISFTRLYSYLSQIMPFYDMELEKLYPYYRFFLRKIPKGNIDPRLFLDDKVALEYYRIEKISSKDLNLVKEDSELQGVTEAGIKRKKGEEKAPLSEIIQVINEKFGTDFEEADRLFFEQVVEDCVSDEQLKQQAKANSFENFKFPFRDIFDEKVIERMDQNQEIFNRMMAGGEFGELVFNAIMKEVYGRLKGNLTPTK